MAENLRDLLNDALALRGNGTLRSLPGSPSFMLSSPQFARLLPPSLPFKWILSCALSLSSSRYNCDDGQPSARKEPSCLNGRQDLPVCQQRCNSEASKKFTALTVGKTIIS